MFEWKEQHKMMREVMRQYAMNEIEPKVPQMESGELLPFDQMRHMLETFQMKEMIATGIKKLIEKKSKSKDEPVPGAAEGAFAGADDPAIGAIVSIELSRVSPGFMLSFGASLGLAGQTILARGNAEQIEQWGLPVMTMDKIGAWGMTEPTSGSDAFSLRTSAKPDGDHYILNGSKTFITNAPYADTHVVYAKIDMGDSEKKRDKRYVFPFVLDKDTPGLSVSKPMKKMGMKGSPTGEVFLDDVRVHKSQMLGDLEQSARSQVKDVFAGERSGSAPMSLGIIDRCLEICLKYTMERKQFDRPLAEFQLIQEKVGKMYVAQQNVENMVFKQIWQAKNKKGTWEEACAQKYYATETAVDVAMDAVQVLGGYGYMEEYIVERLARDAKLLCIGGGTSEIQILNVARHLYRKQGMSISIY